MVVLTYDSAKRSLLFLALYLVIASLAFNGLGMVMEGNVAAAIAALMPSSSGFSSFDFQLPEFDFNTWSFDGIKTYLSEKINEFMQLILPTSLALINLQTLSGTAPAVVHADKTMMVLRV